MNDYKYWVNQDGVQAGPVTRAELENMALTDAAYVWRSGMADWVRITEMSELAGCYAISAVPEGVEHPAAVPDVSPCDAEAANVPADDALANADGDVPMPPVEMPVPPVDVPAPPAAGQHQAAYAPQQGYNHGPQPGHAYGPQAGYSYPMAPVASDAQAKCPPTNLVWAILTTLLCCLPFGVVAIIYSTKVSAKFNQGDIEAAKHYSEVSAWWCIASIIAAIVFTPLFSVIQLL